MSRNIRLDGLSKPKSDFPYTETEIANQNTNQTENSTYLHEVFQFFAIYSVRRQICPKLLKNRKMAITSKRVEIEA